MTPDKPLGQKAYGSIPHLPGSRTGPGDHSCPEGQARIATVRTRDRRDRVYVQEKLDGSCVSVARVDGELVALGRAGYLARTSRYEMHHLWADYVDEHRARFAGLLGDGERAVGEWLAQAHGTRYALAGREPFVMFDLMRGSVRAPTDVVMSRGDFSGIATPGLICEGATSVEAAVEFLGERGFYGAIDPVEGVVWRVERDDAVDFLVKYVRPGKVDGLYLDSLTGGEPVWNWRPRASVRK